MTSTPPSSEAQPQVQQSQPSQSQPNPQAPSQPPANQPQPPLNAQANKTSLIVNIVSAESTVYRNEVKAITSFNETGKFDILPFHANFISIILNQAVVHELDGSKKEFPLEVAVLRVFNNVVDIFLGIEKTDILNKSPVIAAIKGNAPEAPSL